MMDLNDRLKGLARPENAVAIRKFLSGAEYQESTERFLQSFPDDQLKVVIEMIVEVASDEDQIGQIVVLKAGGRLRFLCVVAKDDYLLDHRILNALIDIGTPRTGIADVPVVLDGCTCMAASKEFLDTKGIDVHSIRKAMLRNLNDAESRGKTVVTRSRDCDLQHESAEIVAFVRQHQPTGC